MMTRSLEDLSNIYEEYTLLVDMGESPREVPQQNNEEARQAEGSVVLMLQ